MSEFNVPGGIFYSAGDGVCNPQTADPSPSLAANFTVASPALPSGFTFTRLDAISTFRDSSGIMRLSTANTPRWDHDASGNALGMRMETTRTNTCTNFNMSPTDLTGVTAGGDVLAVVSAVTDTTNLTTAGLQSVGNAKVIEVDNTLGTGVATATISGTIGSVSKSSLSAYAYVVSGTGGSIGSSSGAGIKAFTNSIGVYGRVTTDNFTPGSTSDQMMVTVNAGAKVRFILNQFEVGAHSSSVIKVAGGTGLRNNELHGHTSINTAPYFNTLLGSLIADFIFEDVTACALNTMIGIYDSTNGIAYVQRVYRQAAATRRKTVPQFDINSIGQYGFDIGSYAEVGKRYAAAMTWSDGVQATAATGSVSYQHFPLVGNQVGIVHLYIGNRGGVEQINGWIRGYKIYTSFLTVQQMGKQMVLAGENVFPTSGQSNGTNWFSAQTGSNNTGELTAMVNINAAYTTTRNWLANGGTVSTSVLYLPGLSGADNWWYDPATGNIGTPFKRWVNMMQGCANGTFLCIIDTSGESDAGNCTKQQFMDGMWAKLNIMRQYVGNLKMAIVPIGAESVANDGLQTIREAQWQLPITYPNDFFLCPERMDLALDVTGIHMTDAATGTCADRTTRKVLKVLGKSISGGVDGPAITAVSRSGTTVTVTITHDGGTDFTPTTAIAGFRYYNGADYTTAANVVTAAVRTNATTITLTLTSSSAGTLYYGKGSLSLDTRANLVLDNSAQALPLKSSKWTVA